MLEDHGLRQKWYEQLGRWVENGLIAPIADPHSGGKSQHLRKLVGDFVVFGDFDSKDSRRMVEAMLGEHGLTIYKMFLARRDL